MYEQYDNRLAIMHVTFKVRKSQENTRGWVGEGGELHRKTTSFEKLAHPPPSPIHLIRPNSAYISYRFLYQVGPIVDEASGNCLEISEKETKYSLRFEKCNNSDQQKWTWQHYYDKDGNEI